MNYDTLFQTIQSYVENSFPNTYVTDTNGDQQTVDPKTQIDQFIQQAEQRIYNTVQFPSLRKNVTGATTSGNKYLSCPSDFLAVYSLALYGYFTTTATGVSGEYDIEVASATNLAIGQYVIGTNIGSGAIVEAIDGTTITLTVANTGTVSGNAIFQSDFEYLLNKDVNFIRAAYPSPLMTGEPKYYALFGAQSNDINELSIILGPTPDKSYYAELHYYYYPESITTAASGSSWLGDNFDSVLLYGSLVEAYTYMKGEQDIITYYETKYKEALGMAKRLGDGMERGDAYRDGQYKQKVI